MHVYGFLYNVDEPVTTLQEVSVMSICRNKCIVVILQRSAFQKTKETFGGIDIVCNNAGIGNENKWRLTLDINLVRFPQIGDAIVWLFFEHCV